MDQENILVHKKLSNEQIVSIKAVKDAERVLLDLIDTAMKTDGGGDRRWLAIAQMDIEKGVMGAVRAISNPL